VSKTAFFGVQKSDKNRTLKTSKNTTFYDFKSSYKNSPFFTIFVIFRHFHDFINFKKKIKKIFLEKKKSYKNKKKIFYKKNKLHFHKFIKVIKYKIIKSSEHKIIKVRSIKL